MKLSKLALVLGATLAFTLSIGGCSSKSEDKEPHLANPNAPKLKRVGQGVGPSGGPAPQQKTQGPTAKP
ncbi:MAG TPA: hypothetical protein VGF55_01550 [Gemmataceae bacterium]